MDNVQLDKMVEVTEKMMTLVTEHHDEVSLNAEFSAYNNQAIVLRRMGDLEDALKYYHKALEIAEWLNNYRYIAIVSINIGVIHYYAGDFHECSASWATAIKAAERSKSLFSVLTNSINLSIVHKILHQYGKVLQVLEKAQPYLDKVNATREHAKLNMLHADIMLELGELDETKIRLDKAEEYYDSAESLKVSYEYHDIKLIQSATHKRERLFNTCKFQTANEINYIKINPFS